MKFVKMHGAGNDYVFCDGFSSRLPDNPSEVARAISDRHFGIGADGLVLIIPPATETTSDPCDPCDVVMRMWNADGSEGSLCGNAARCVAFWMKRRGRVDAECRIQMGPLLLKADVSAVDADCLQSDQVRLELPAPQTVQRRQLRIAGLPGCVVEAGADVEGTDLSYWQVDVGNPHAVLQVDRLSKTLLTTAGPLIETHADFPDRTNVEFVRVIDSGRLEVLVWERGSGSTLACGSGACAAAIAMVSAGRCEIDDPMDVVLPGGTLAVSWDGNINPDNQRQQNSSLTLRGPVCQTFEGTWSPSSARDTEYRAESTAN